MTTIHPLRVSILLPGRFGDLDLASRYGKVMQNCPSCSAELVLLMEKFGEVGDLSKSPQRPLAAPVVGESRDMMTGGWYCSHCGVHIMPGEDVRLVKAVDQLLHPRTDASPEHKHKDSNQLLNHQGKLLGSGSQSPDQSKPLSQQHSRESSLHLDEDYLSWETQMQTNFTQFLQQIREHLLQKERQLQEYQIDLCQREKTLQMNEDSVQERQQQLDVSEKDLSHRKAEWSKYKEEMMSQVQRQMATMRQRYEDGRGPSINGHAAQTNALVSSPERTLSKPNRIDFGRDSGTFSASPSSPPEVMSPGSYPREPVPAPGPSRTGLNEQFPPSEDGTGGFDRYSPTRRPRKLSNSQRSPTQLSPTGENNRKYSTPDRYYKGTEGHGRYDPYTPKSPTRLQSPPSDTEGRSRTYTQEGAEGNRNPVNYRGYTPDGAEGQRGQGSPERSYDLDRSLVHPPSAYGGSNLSGEVTVVRVEVERTPPPVSQESKTDAALKVEKTHPLTRKDSNLARRERYWDQTGLHRADGMDDLQQASGHNISQKHAYTDVTEPLHNPNSPPKPLPDYTIGMIPSPPSYGKQFGSSDDILNGGRKKGPSNMDSLTRSQSSEVLLPEGQVQPTRQRLAEKPRAARDNRYSANDDDVFTPGLPKNTQDNAGQGTTGRTTRYDQVDASHGMTGRPARYDPVPVDASAGMTGRPTRYGPVPVDASHGMTGRPTRYDPVPIDASHGMTGRPARHDQVDASAGMTGRPTRYDPVPIDASHGMTGRPARHDQVDASAGMTGRPTRYGPVPVDASHGMTGRPTRYDPVPVDASHGMTGRPARYGPVPVDASAGMTGRPTRHDQVDASAGMTGRPARYDPVPVDASHGMTGPTRHDQVDASAGMTGRPTRYDPVPVDASHGMTGRPTRYDPVPVDASHGMTGRPARYDPVPVDASAGMTGRPTRYDPVWVDASHGMTGRPTRHDQVDASAGMTGRPARYDPVPVDASHGMTGRPARYDQVPVDASASMTGRPTRYDPVPVDASHGMTGRPARHDQVDASAGMTGRPTRYDPVPVDASHSMTGRPKTHEPDTANQGPQEQKHNTSYSPDKEKELYHLETGINRLQVTEEDSSIKPDQYQMGSSPESTGHLMTVGTIPPKETLNVRYRMGYEPQPSRATERQHSPPKTHSPPQRVPRPRPGHLELQDKSQWTIAQRREDSRHYGEDPRGRPKRYSEPLIKSKSLVIHRDEQTAVGVRRKTTQPHSAPSMSAQERLAQTRRQPQPPQRSSGSDVDSSQRAVSQLTEVSDSSGQFFEFSPTYKSWLDKYGSLEDKPRRDRNKKQDSPPSPKTPSQRPHIKLPNYNTYVRAITHDYNDYRSSLPTVPSPDTHEQSLV